MNQNNTPSVARLMETLNNLFYLMVGLSLLAFAWVYLNMKAITPNIIFSVPGYRPYLHTLIILISFGLLVMALLQYRRRISYAKNSSWPVNNQEMVKEKVGYFREASLKLYLFLTLSTLLIVAGFYLSAEPGYAAAYSVLLIAFSLFRPTTDRLTKDMHMKEEEREYYYRVVKEEKSAQEGG